MEIRIDVINKIEFGVDDFKNNYDGIKKSSVGVYVFKNEHGDAVYVGKSKNLHKRISAHLGGNSNVKDLMDHTTHCEVFFIEDYSLADIYETYLINSLKPLSNLDKASYPEFIKMAEESLSDISYEIELLEQRLSEISIEIEEYDDDDEYALGEVLYLQKEASNIESKIKLLKQKVSRLKRRGAKSLENETSEEKITNIKRMKSAAFLRLRGKGR
jgi:DNA polymerase III subunit epsilon